MDTLASFGYGLAIFFFWLLALIAIGGLIAAIVGLIQVIVYHDYHNDSRYDDYKALLIGGLLFFLVFGTFAYLMSGPADYKPYIQGKYNRIVHFSNKEVKLEKKVNELSDLRSQLTQKHQEVKRLQIEYGNDIRSLTNEIKAEQKANHIQTFVQAQQHPRIAYDLSLIQRKKAYIAKLQETEIKLQHGNYELEFLEREAIDDQKMVKTLNNEAVEKLVVDINNIIAKYLPEAGKLAVDIDPNSMQTPEQIWQEINSGN